jgi:hypothetical protein
MSKELRQAKHRLANPDNACIHAMLEEPYPAISPLDFQEGKV